MNKVILKGRLAQDPELRETATNIPVTSFTVAVQNRESRDNSATFIDCVAWRDDATFIKRFFTRGKEIALTGRLSVRDWTDKDGNKRRSYEVVVDRNGAEFCGSNDTPHYSEFQPLNTDSTATTPPPPANTNFKPYDELTDDDLPF